MNAPTDEPALAWLELARGDLHTARVLISHGAHARRNGAFLAQQAAEKALKAALVRADIPPPRIHDLVTLATRLPEGAVELALEQLAGLSRWAVTGRYPSEDADVPSEQLLDEQLATAADVLEQVEAFVSPSSTSDPSDTA